MTIHQSSDGGGPERLRHDEPLCNEEEFAQEVQKLVDEEALRMFALVQEYGERVDGWIIAWGLAFRRPHRNHPGERWPMRVNSPEHAQQALSRRRRRTIRLVWTNPAHPLVAVS